MFNLSVGKSVTAFNPLLVGKNRSQRGPLFAASSKKDVFQSQYKALLGAVGLDHSSLVYYQKSPSALIRHALKRQEGALSNNGILTIKTGQYTGRSPNDRFIVDSAKVHATVDWKNNLAISSEAFDKIFEKVKTYLKNKPVFVFDGYAGADPQVKTPVRFYNELASQNLFVHQMFIRPSKQELKQFVPQLTVISAPGLKLDPKTDGVNSEVGILLNLEKGIVLIAGTHYSGELKKSVFSVMNHHLPDQNILPLHAAATEGKDGKVSLLIGLSGTGKTTLATTADQQLIGDDEIAWTEHGLSNFEGGCYASALHLSSNTEPEVWQALKPTALAENVVLQEKTQSFDFNDATLSPNTRVVYPLHFLPTAKSSEKTGHPDTIVLLTSDASGVLPPISKLTQEQALYHFMNGYTSKLGGTERGVLSPKPVFSHSFGAPFMLREASVYAKLFEKRLKDHPANYYLINTGWQGGPFGTGKRIGLAETRAMLKAVMHGDIEKQPFWTHPIFHVQVPASCPGISDKVLNPRASWPDKSLYDIRATQLVSLFKKNFQRFPDFSNLAENVWKS